MDSTAKDSLLPVSAIEADAMARALSDNRIGVEKVHGKTYLTHVGRRYRVHLLPYQLTIRGIREAVAENDPWPGE
jgi:hypothetical protein